MLDLGVGTGRLLPDLTERGKFVCGMDISRAVLTHARKRAGPHASFVLGDAQRLPFAAESFDRVVAWAVWENIPDQRLALAEAVRVLRPRGRLYQCAVPTACRVAGEGESRPRLLAMGLRAVLGCPPAFVQA